jgi:1,4-alpha-glucan branching enzyme
MEVKEEKYARKKKKENVRKRRVTMRPEAPKAKEVILMGDFNKWNAKIHPMKKTKGGVWERS